MNTLEVHGLKWKRAFAPVESRVQCRNTKKKVLNSRALHSDVMTSERFSNYTSFAYLQREYKRGQRAWFDK